ncbi:MAG: hypothetical protein ACI9JM_000293 [Halioglobus sp.]|jgi:hypothetical protein
MRIIKLAALLFFAFLATPATASLMSSVTVDGKEWLQPADFTSLAPREILEVCPEGTCTSGTLNGHNMTGWTWASIEVVIGLLDSVTPYSEGYQPSGNSAFLYVNFEGDAVWATDWFDALDFVPTNIENQELIFRATSGWSYRSRSTNTGSWRRASVLDGISPGVRDQVSTSFLNSSRFRSVGAWFYRPAQVPTSSTLILLILAISLLLASQLARGQKA